MIVDVNVYLERWPFRRTPCDELPALVARLRKHGVEQAWVGSIDGLFHRDVGAVNRRLADACHKERQVQLVPFGTVNPMLPDWQEDLRRCHEDYHMPGIRLHPNYHGYELNDPACAELLDLAAKRKLIVQLALRMDDIRVQHRLMTVADVDTKPLADLVKARPGLRVVVLHGLVVVRGAVLKALAATGRVWFEISTQEGVGGVAKLINDYPANRVLFGSHLPLYALESAVLKMKEAELSESQRRAIESENARSLLAG
jgi:uncharacterized protein